MKKVVRTVSLILVSLVAIACIVFSIRAIIQFSKDTSATPVPGKALLLGEACEYYGQMVEIEGRLELTNDTICSTEEPYTCRLTLFDPYWRDSVYLTIPVYQGSGDLPSNQMAKLPESYDSGDFLIRTSDNLFARDGSLISVRGIENHSSGRSSCTISSIESIKMLDHLVVDVGVDLTSLTLQEAISEGLVVATITGNGLSQIRISLKPNIEVNYEIEIEPGTMFISGTEGVQNMVVRQEQTVYLKPNLEISLDLEVSCANMTLKEPSYSDAFSISTEPINADLLKLLMSKEFSTFDLTIQQFAIWTITDNPSDAYSYTSINQGGQTERPTTQAINQIRALFEKAGIDITKYLVFVN